MNMDTERPQDTGPEEGDPEYMASEQWRAENAAPPETAVAEEGGTRDGGHVRRVEVGHAEGDLTVRGSSEPHVMVNAPGFDREDELFQPTETADGTLRFASLPDHAELIVPRGTAVSLREVDSDLRAEDVVGGFSAGWVRGDASVSGTPLVELGQIAGDLRARACGTLRVREVGGDTHLDDVDGAVELGRIGGDLDVHSVAGLYARETIGGDVQVDGCAGDAYLRGPVGGGVQASACGGDVHIGSVGGDLVVRLGQAVHIDGAVGGDCELAEIVGDVEIRGAVGGDLSASLVGDLSIAGSVGGEADLATIGHAVRLRTVGGDLKADGLAGPLTVGTVGGGARIRTCLGAMQINLVGGDLDVQRATAGLAVARVGGDVELDTPLAAGAEYQVRAAGDIRLRVRGEVNARFVAQTSGGEIRTRLPLAVERGRRRNLVGALGRGDAAVTLHSDGGDISIAGAYGSEEDMMGDEFVGTGTSTAETEKGTSSSGNPRSWEGNFGGHKFRVRWDARAPGAPDDPDGVGAPRRGFGFEWQHNPEADRKAAEDFERRMNDLRDKAEQVARRATEQAQRYAERAARRARETDWEAIGREVRTAIERAMTELEDTVGQLRRDFDTRRGPSGSGPAGAGPSSSGAQRVRIEHDEPGDAYSPSYGASTPEPAGAGGDLDARRRAILEDLRAGTISLDEAERRLGELR
jgi:Putative adhesin